MEAVLPLPQVVANARTKSTRGFRPSVLASWLAGDVMKMFWFFTATSTIPWAFKLCAMFQAVCDSLLAAQYLSYARAGTVIKGHPVEMGEVSGGFGRGAEDGKGALSFGDRRTP